MDAPVPKMTASPETAHPHPRDRHAVGDAGFRPPTVPVSIALACGLYEHCDVIVLAIGALLRCQVSIVEEPFGDDLAKTNMP